MPGLTDPPNPPGDGSGEEPEKPSAHERYAAAYAEGQIAAGAEAYPAPDSKHHGPLAQMCEFAKAPDGKLLRGPALDAWFRKTSQEYRRQYRDHAQYTSGFAPAKCLDWLKGGRQAPRAGPNSTPAPTNDPSRRPMPKSGATQ